MPNWTDNTLTVTGKDYDGIKGTWRDFGTRTKGVVDEGGTLLMMKRMAGASGLSTEICQEKAKSAAVSRRATKVSEDITQSFKWGKTDVENYQLGFTSAHLMSTLDPEDQNKLFSACFEGAKKGITFPGKEELKRIKQYYNENKPDKTIDDAIEFYNKGLEIDPNFANPRSLVTYFPMAP